MFPYLLPLAIPTIVNWAVKAVTADGEKDPKPEANPAETKKAEAPAPTADTRLQEAENARAKAEMYAAEADAQRFQLEWQLERNDAQCTRETGKMSEENTACVAESNRQARTLAEQGAALAACEEGRAADRNAADGDAAERDAELALYQEPFQTDLPAASGSEGAGATTITDISRLKGIRLNDKTRVPVKEGDPQKKITAAPGSKISLVFEVPDTVPLPGNVSDPGIFLYTMQCRYNGVMENNNLQAVAEPTIAKGDKSGTRKLIVDFSVPADTAPNTEIGLYDRSGTFHVIALVGEKASAPAEERSVEKKTAVKTEPPKEVNYDDIDA